MKTYVQKAADIRHDWIVVDASQAPLGRVATLVARRLSGKYQTGFTPHIDTGDHVIVINAAQLKATGTKLDDKQYYRHSNYPGGIRQESLGHKLAAGKARQVIEAAVYGMLPKNKLRPQRMLRLHVFDGAEHSHTAQKPTQVEVRA